MIIKKTAAFLALTLGLTLFLSLGMGHWMSEEPMHHGEHECCDFVPIQRSNAPNGMLVFLPTLAVVSVMFALYRNELLRNRVSFHFSSVRPPGRQFLKGIVQRE